MAGLSGECGRYGDWTNSGGLGSWSWEFDCPAVSTSVAYTPNPSPGVTSSGNDFSVSANFSASLLIRVIDDFRYISELSPPSHRGRLVVINVLFITFGQLIAYAVGLVLSPPTLSQDLSWRFMLGLGGVPAVFQFIFMFFMPETPRWLIQHSRRRDAAEVVRKVYGGLSERSVELILVGIEQGVEAVTKDPLAAKLKALFSVGSNRRALVISCLLQGLQQACGFNSLMYYSATIFSLVGFKNPTATAMVIAGTNMAFTALAFTLIDRIGRRRILLWSIPGMAVGLLLCALAFRHLPILMPFISPEPSSSPWTPLLILFMMAYVSAYALGIGAIPWIVQSEFFPMRVRGLGTGMATATNWVLNFIVGVTFLPAVEWMWGGAQGLFIVYAVVCGVGWVAVNRIYPETRGLRMEEIEVVLRDGWGVRSDREREAAEGEEDE